MRSGLPSVTKATRSTSDTDAVFPGRRPIDASSRRQARSGPPGYGAARWWARCAAALNVRRIRRRTDVGALRDLGDAMRARRQQLGLKLTDVAAGTGLSVPFLSQVETSFATPSLTSLFAIARVLETTPERLLAGPDPAAVVLTRSDEGREYSVTDADRAARRRQISGLGEPFSVSEYVVAPGVGPR